MKRLLIGTVAAVALSGCASQPTSIQKQSVSELQYQAYTCDQVALEEDRVSRRVSELHSSLKDKADKDAMQMGVGLVLFWPTLFFLEGGDGPEAVEYGRLRGEHEAIERVAIKKSCGLTIIPVETQLKAREEEERKRAEAAKPAV